MEARANLAMGKRDWTNSTSRRTSVSRAHFPGDPVICRLCLGLDAMWQGGRLLAGLVSGSPRSRVVALGALRRCKVHRRDFTPDKKLVVMSSDIRRCARGKLNLGIAGWPRFS